MLFDHEEGPTDLSRICKFSQGRFKELAQLEPWISMYDRNVLYVLVQLLHSSLKGSGKLDKDTEFEIFMFAQTVNIKKDYDHFANIDTNEENDEGNTNRIRLNLKRHLTA